ncbi:restriction endonuclease subunit S [Psychrobacter glacincola]|uniref:restriction endonuclease subunit S n=1 Tax=Psychrobacter glacincola TaxID=56810 RepID=UPI0039AF8CE6
MAKYQQYNEYKDSGVEWLGRIPHGWKVLRGKYVFQEFRERSTTGEEVLLSVSEYYGVKPRSEKISEGDHLSRAESLVDYKKCYKNDLVMNIMLAWKRGLGVSKYDGIVSPAYSVFRFNKGIHPYFMHHLFRTDLYTSHFKTRSTGVIDSRLRLYPESFLDTEILIPSYEEQAQIANFLEHETAQIDTLIEKQQILIQLLKEKRQAVISHAVTKGLNPDAPMKNSGVEWLGEVPEHWEVSKLKYLISEPLQYGANEAAEDVDKTHPRFVRITDVLPNGNLKDDTFRSLPQDIAEPYMLMDGDVLLARSGGTVGKSFIYRDSWGKCCFAGYLIKAKIDENITPAEWFYLNTLTDFYWKWIESIQIQATIQNVSADKYNSFVIAVPPLEESYKIISHIKFNLEVFDTLVMKAEQAIQLMQERRTALISAAVTGKIDVRGWRVPE